MEFSILAVWLHRFLLIMGGCLILFLLLLFISNKRIKKKLDRLEQND